MKPDRRVLPPALARGGSGNGRPAVRPGSRLHRNPPSIVSQRSDALDRRAHAARARAPGRASIGSISARWTRVWRASSTPGINPPYSFNRSRACGLFSDRWWSALWTTRSTLARGGFRKWIASEWVRSRPGRAGVRARASSGGRPDRVDAPDLRGQRANSSCWPLFARSSQIGLLQDLGAGACWRRFSRARCAEEKTGAGGPALQSYGEGGHGGAGERGAIGAPAVLMFGGETAIASVTHQLRPDAKFGCTGQGEPGYIGAPRWDARRFLTLARLVRRGRRAYTPARLPFAARGLRGGGAASTPVDFAAALGEALEECLGVLAAARATASKAASVNSIARRPASRPRRPEQRSLTGGKGRAGRSSRKWRAIRAGPRTAWSGCTRSRVGGIRARGRAVAPARGGARCGRAGSAPRGSGRAPRGAGDS